MLYLLWVKNSSGKIIFFHLKRICTIQHSGTRQAPPALPSIKHTRHFLHKTFRSVTGTSSGDIDSTMADFIDEFIIAVGNCLELLQQFSITDIISQLYISNTKTRLHKQGPRNTVVWERRINYCDE